MTPDTTARVRVAVRAIALTLALAVFAATTAQAQGATAEIIHRFTTTLPYAPSGFVQASDGEYFATLTTGGPGGGALVKVTAGGAVTALHYFDKAEGGFPDTLTLGADGLLYGVTRNYSADDGQSARSSIFKATRTGQVTVLKQFLYGEDVLGDLVAATDGNLYGATDEGRLFRVTPSGAYTEVRRFVSTEPGSLHQSASRLSPPMQASNGLLYFFVDNRLCGMSLDGTVQVLGTRVDPSSRFSAFFIHQRLTQGRDGFLYGTQSGYDSSSFSAGLVFKAALNGTTTIIQNLPSSYYDPGPLLAADDGNLYTVVSGSLVRISQAGAITPVNSDVDGGLVEFDYRGGATFVALIGSRLVVGDTSGTLRAIHRFEGGTEPTRPIDLVRGVDGAIYGLSETSGAVGGGTVFRLALDGTVDVIARLELSGAGNLAVGADGTLYGAMSARAGAGWLTKLFKRTQQGALTTFDVGDAGYPRSLVATPAGDVLFITDRDQSCGTIERLGSTGQHSVVKTLNESTDGCVSRSSTPLVLGSDGNVYGTTSRSLFRVDSSARFTIVQVPTAVASASMASGADGWLYGVSEESYCGSKSFRFDPASGTFSPLQTLKGVCGVGRLVAAAGGFYSLSGYPQGLRQLSYDGSTRFIPLFYSSSGLTWVGDGTLLDVSTVDGVGVARRITIGQPARGVSGDLNGDRKSDLVVFRPSSSTWFTPSPAVPSYPLGETGDVPLLADFDGDGLADSTAYHPSTGRWTTVSTNTSVVPRSRSFQWGTPGDLPLAGYFDDDGMADAAVYRPSTGQWFIRYSSTVLTGQFGYFSWGVPGDLPLVADFDGDGKAEISVYRPSTGQWFIRYSTRGYTADSFGYFEWGATNDIPLTGDFDGDGKADLVVFRPGTGTWSIRHSSTGYPIGAGNWIFQFGQSGDEPIAADFDGDGRSDIALYRPATNQWLIRYSTMSYDPAAVGSVVMGAAGDVPVLRSTVAIPAAADLSARRTGPGSVALSWTASAGATSYVIKRGTSPQNLLTIATGITANGYSDAAPQRRAYHYAVTAIYGSVPSMDTNSVAVNFRAAVPDRDVNGDGLSDLVLFGLGGAWSYAAAHTGSPFGNFASLAAWGGTGDVPLSADFDGDGKIDPAVYRVDTNAGIGQFAALLSSQDYAYAYFRQLGQPGDVPIPSDFDGDGKADAAVYRPSTGQWIVENGFTTSRGAQGDAPVLGDFDGDGKTDLAVFRHATGGWFIRFSAANYALDQAGSLKWGDQGDQPLAADFDGDGISDVAVYRPSARVFYVRRSSTGTTLGIDMSTEVLGDAEPVLGDFDGDGKADVVLRVSSGSTAFWRVRLSGDDYAHRTQTSNAYGWWTDIPVPQASAPVRSPGAFVATRASVSRIQLSWEPRRGASSYTIRRGLTPGAMATIATGIAETAFTDTVPGRDAYYYAITAVYAFNESGSATALAPAFPRAVPNTDVDGDGISDLMVFRPSTGEWLFRNSSSGFGIGLGTWRLTLGSPGDMPLRADVDGDGKLDPIVYRADASGNRNFVGLRSSSGYQSDFNATIQKVLYPVAPVSDSDVPEAADLDGDGKADLGFFSRNTGVWVFALSSNNYAAAPDGYTYDWYRLWGTLGDEPLTGDFDGDGRTDIGVFRPRTGQWLLLDSTRDHRPYGDDPAVFELGRVGDRPVPADFDGDGTTDLAVYRPGTGEWFVRYSTAGFDAGTGAAAFRWGIPGDEPIVGDLDGDTRADVIAYRPSVGRWFVLYSSRGYDSGQAGSYDWGMLGDIVLPHTATPQIPAPIDFAATRTGARTARLSWTASPGAVSYVVKRRVAWGTFTTVATNVTGTTYVDTAPRGLPYYYAVAATYDVGSGADAQEARVVFPPAVPNSDMDGDGITDFVLYRPSAGYWYIRNSSVGYTIGGGPSFFAWGPAGAVPAPGDYDGDGRLDVAVASSSPVTWSGLLSSKAYQGYSLQLTLGAAHAAGDVPMAGDFDGDGAADPALYQPSTGGWFVSTSRYGVWYQWGATGDLPLMGDFDGDGMADVTVFRPSTGRWYIRYSGNEYTRLLPGVFTLGAADDTPMPADYDGDGTTDLAVYRPSTGQWLVRYSSLGFARSASDLTVQWGLAGDEPRVGDFDGDGKSDISARRPSTGQWFILYSSRNYDTGQAGYFEWGAEGDIALP